MCLIEQYQEINQHGPLRRLTFALSKYLERSLPWYLLFLSYFFLIATLGFQSLHFCCQSCQNCMPFHSFSLDFSSFLKRVVGKPSKVRIRKLRNFLVQKYTLSTSQIADLLGQGLLMNGPTSFWISTIGNIQNLFNQGCYQRIADI